MTKPVTAVAVMTLVEKGVIALSDPVSNFIPSFKNQTVLTKKGYVPAKREVHSGSSQYDSRSYLP